MRNLLLLLALPFSLDYCSSPPATDLVPAPPSPKVADATVDAVVRLDMGDSFRGSAVMVTPTYAVASLATLPEYDFWKYRVTLGSERTPGKIVAVDERHGLALIRSDRAARAWVTFVAPPGPKERDEAVIVGYTLTDNEPPLVSKQQFPSSVASVHERGESTEKLDLADMMTVSMSGMSGKMQTGGACVFAPKPDRFIGIVIGKALRDTTSLSTTSAPMLTVPASVVATFMAQHGVRPAAPAARR